MAKRVEYVARTEILNSVLRWYALFCNLALFTKVIEVGKEKKNTTKNKRYVINLCIVKVMFFDNGRPLCLCSCKKCKRFKIRKKLKLQNKSYRKNHFYEWHRKPRDESAVLRYRATTWLRSWSKMLLSTNFRLRYMKFRIWINESTNVSIRK